MAGPGVNWANALFHMLCDMVRRHVQMTSVLRRGSQFLTIGREVAWSLYCKFWQGEGGQKSEKFSWRDLYKAPNQTQPSAPLRFDKVNQINHRVETYIFWHLTRMLRRNGTDGRITETNQRNQMIGGGLPLFSCCALDGADNLGEEMKGWSLVGYILPARYIKRQQKCKHHSSTKPSCTSC